MNRITKFREKIQNHSKYDKVLGWGKLISITGSAQIAVQALGMLSGIIIIRLLSVEEYAFYTIANTMLATMTTLADGGISRGVLAEGGKVWRDSNKLGSVIVTGLKLRRKFALLSFLITLPVLIYLLSSNGASWKVILFIVLSIIPAFYAALSDTILQIIPKLHQNIPPLQKNQLVVATGRLFFMSASVFIFPFTFVALLGSGIPRMLGNIRLKKIGEKQANLECTSDDQVEKEIVKIVKRILPGAVYYCFYGQISIWLISIFGNTDGVAQLGALGRFSSTLSLVTILLSTLIIPRYAKLKNVKSLLVSKFLISIIPMVLLLALICIGFYVFSDLLLSILGKDYSGLNLELLLCIIGSSLSVTSGIIFSLNSARSWVLNPILSIVISLTSIIIGSLFFDLSSLLGILKYNIFLGLSVVLMNLFYFIYNILKLNKDTHEEAT